jgi:basic membrane protein A
MKKLFALLAAIVAVVALSACAPTYEVAMITDVGGIDDESFNQGTWEGIVEFCESNDLTYKYYKPLGENPSDAEYMDAIDLAIENGAKIVVTPGFLFGYSIYEKQDEYPDVKFVLLDDVPHDATYENFNTADNTIAILFAEHESGFLAGYAAVMDGYRTLGFTGGIALPAVVKFGVGYVAGAFYAADELGLTDFTFADGNYAYFGNFDANDTNKTLAATMYNNGVEVIFSAAGGAGSSVISAAVDADTVMIGVDVDQSSKGDVVLTSAMKRLAVAVQDALEGYLAGEFEGGVTKTLDASVDGVGLPFENSRFDTFTEDDYNAILGLVQDGTVVVPSDAASLATFLDDLGVDAADYPTADTINGVTAE